MMDKVPETVPEEERIWFALAAYNMGYAHMIDARALTAKTKGNADSWSDVKQRLPLLSQKPLLTHRHRLLRGLMVLLEQPLSDW